MEQTIDNYRLTSTEDPTVGMLTQIMREAAEEARRTNEEATAQFFARLRQEAKEIEASW